MNITFQVIPQSCIVFLHVFLHGAVAGSLDTSPAMFESVYKKIKVANGFKNLPSHSL